jgi:DeoR/GlpR family transcriptional regulator of sugar metabolism
MQTRAKDLFLEERRQEILRQVNETGRALVGDLSQLFGVSEVTIRADLQALADQKLLVRTHGGAMPAHRAMSDLSLTLRLQQQVVEKSRIGEAGAAMVSDGDAIFLDSSSTALAIARRLRDRKHLTVVSNSLAVAQDLVDAPGVTVIMPGGVLRRETASLVRSDDLDKLSRLNLQTGFFGAHGLSIAEGLTDVSADEAEVKRPLVALCRQVVAVIDATKWGRVGVASFAHLHQIDRVITNSPAPEALVSEARALGVEVIVV